MATLKISDDLKHYIRDYIYPVGSIYISSNSTSPETLFGGTWEQITGYYLYAGTGGTTAGSNTSGESSGDTGTSTGSTGTPSTNTTGTPSTTDTGPTTLTIDQIPSHDHGMANGVQYLYVYGSSSGVEKIGVSMSSNGYWHESYKGASTFSTQGGGKSHTHTLNSHTHTLSNHTHSLNSHTHSLNNHTHSVTPLRYEFYTWIRTA